MIDLVEILSYNRRHGSSGETTFIGKLLTALHKFKELNPHVEIEADSIGNIWVTTAPKDVAPYLFVAHIDTCHKGDARPTFILQHDNKIRLTTPDAGCLGADDGVGLFINLSMIEAGTKGTFLFTRGEEAGLIGADWIVEYTPEKLEDFSFSIEIDREGTDEIIIEQMTGKCASKEFGEELAKKLDMKHEISYHGVYTDNSVFNEFIPENVNISAGYMFQHSVKEELDVAYVMSLLMRMKEVDWSTLPISRSTKDFGERYDQWGYPANNSRYTQNLPRNYFEDYEMGRWNGHFDTSDEMDMKPMSKSIAEEYVEEEALKVAYYLYVNGVSPAEIEEAWLFGKGI